MSQQLVKELSLKQRALNLNDTHFAHKLNITRRLWGRTKKGDLPTGITLLRAIIRTYPELTPKVIDFLRDGHE